jgi:hypothetical protein
VHQGENQQYEEHQAQANAGEIAPALTVGHFGMLPMRAMIRTTVSTKNISALLPPGNPVAKAAGGRARGVYTIMRKFPWRYQRAEGSVPVRAA